MINVYDELYKNHKATTGEIISENAICWIYSSETGAVRKYENVVIRTFNSKFNSKDSTKAVASHPATKRIFLVFKQEWKPYIYYNRSYVWSNTDDDEKAYQQLYSAQ